MRCHYYLVDLLKTEKSTTPEVNEKAEKFKQEKLCAYSVNENMV